MVTTDYWSQTNRLTPRRILACLPTCVRNEEETNVVWTTSQSNNQHITLEGVRKGRIFEPQSKDGIGTIAVQIPEEIPNHENEIMVEDIELS